MSQAIPAESLIVVADGGKATLYRNTGSGAEVTLTEVRKLSPKDVMLGTPSGNRPGDQSVHQAEEAVFAKQLAQTLHTMLDHNEYKDLVIIADAQTLGQLRDAMHKTVERAVVKSMSKDYTNSSLKEIEKALNH